MATSEILRRDSNGHIISKENKNYHICFKDNIDVIDIQSFKKYNILEHINKINFIHLIIKKIFIYILK